MSIKAVFESRENEANGASTERSGWKRIASATVGAGLVVFGFRNRSVVGSIAALVGGWLVYREARGRRRPDVEYADGSATADDEESEVETEFDVGTDPDAEPSAPVGVDSEAVAERLRSEFDTETPRIERTVTIDESPEELYDLWLEPGTIEQLVGPAGEVTTVDEADRRWRWTVPGPLEQMVTWETELVEDEPGAYLHWTTLEGEQLSSEGSVEFRPAPADRGTEVTLQMTFDPPGGAVGNAVVNRIGIVPKTLASRMLNRFKSLAETGEIPSLETNPSGRGKGDLA